MGLIDNVNVNVGGNGNVIDTLSTYVTKVLKPNIVDGENVLTQDMMSAANTKYVIKYNYELSEDITIPENCVLEFDGGKLSGSYAINYQGMKDAFIYTSWMSIETLQKSIKYMSYKTLIVDTVLELNSPLTGGDNNLLYFTIAGKDSNENKWDDGNNKNHSKIICNNCSAIDIKGWSNVVRDLSFEFSAGGNNNPFVVLDTKNTNVSDLDSEVSNCFFNTNDHRTITQFSDILISNAIVSYGRGLTVKDCLFNGPVNDAYIKCIMKSDTWRPNPGIEVSDKYGGRAFWIHHNRMHMGTARFVHFAINDSAPDCTFRGIRIENNIADIGGSFGLFEAPSFDTVISNNTFIGGASKSFAFLVFGEANEVKICNNVFRGYDNEDMPSVQDNNYEIDITSPTDAEIKDIQINDNIVSVKGYFILVASDIDGIVICNNIVNDQSFTATNCALLRALKNSKNVIIKNNINSSSNANVPAFRAWDSGYEGKGVDNVMIADNAGFLNWITSFGQYTNRLNGRTFTNVFIKYDKGTAPEDTMDASSYRVNVQSRTGFSYINTTLYPVREAIWSGLKWIERDSAKLGVARSGTFANKPAAADIYTGFKYMIVESSPARHMPIFYGGDSKWYDAAGNEVTA